MLGETIWEQYLTILCNHDSPISNKAPVFHSPCNKKTKTSLNIIFFLRNQVNVVYHCIKLKWLATWGHKYLSFHFDGISHLFATLNCGSYHWHLKIKFIYSCRHIKSSLSCCSPYHSHLLQSQE